MDKDLLAEFYSVAQEEARAGVSAKHGGPFGAVVVRGDEIIGRGHNTVLRDNDPTAHAEVNAIRDACRNVGSPHLKGCVLVASSEPCPMCLTTSYWANLDEVRYAVPVAVAAGVGFDDSFIYDELEKSPDQRRINYVHDADMQAAGEKIFSEWKEGEGELY